MIQCNIQRHTTKKSRKFDNKNRLFSAFVKLLFLLNCRTPVEDIDDIEDYAKSKGIKNILKTLAF